MDCVACQRFETELNLVALIHIEKKHDRESGWYSARSSGRGQLRSAENVAMLTFEIMRADLNRHKRNQHGTGAFIKLP
jgi:hypothetical protein